MVKFADEARESREAPGRGIADLDVMARQAENRDGLAGRGTGTFRYQHPERFCTAPASSVTSASSTRPISWFTVNGVGETTEKVSATITPWGARGEVPLAFPGNQVLTSGTGATARTLYVHANEPDGWAWIDAAGPTLSEL